jgi:hypothetical protein
VRSSAPPGPARTAARLGGRSGSRVPRTCCGGRISGPAILQQGPPGYARAFGCKCSWGSVRCRAGRRPIRRAMGVCSTGCALRPAAHAAAPSFHPGPRGAALLRGLSPAGPSSPASPTPKLGGPVHGSCPGPGAGKRRTGQVRTNTQRCRQLPWSQRVGHLARCHRSAGRHSAAACRVRNSDGSVELPFRGTRARYGCASAAATWRPSGCSQGSPTSRCAARSSCSHSWPAAMPPRTWSSWCCATSSASCAAKSHGPGSSPPTVPCWLRSAACCPDRSGPASLSSRRRCCAGTVAWSPARGRILADQGDRRWMRTCRR